MRVCVFLLLLLMRLLGGGSEARPAPRIPRQQTREFRVVAYLPDYRVGTFHPATLNGVTDLVFFSLEPTPAGGIESARFTPAISATLADIKRRYPLRLWVTFGGWERSAGFAPVVRDAARRRQFVQALTQFCLGHHFDGADFDWEHPATAQEESGYTNLLTETRRAFAPHSLRLSVTIASWQKLAPAAIAAVDAVNLMSYDHAGRHSTLEQSQTDVALALAQGIPPAKLCLGVPFYGRGITKPDRALAYADIVTQFHPAANVDEADGLFFNGPQTVRQKTLFALRQHLGGIMVWEVGQDVSGPDSLLNAISQAAHQP